MSQFIKKITGEIIGEVRTDPNGDITVLSYPGRKILAIYRKNVDKTMTLGGHLISWGNTAIAALYPKLSKEFGQK